jgi:hypothetical protein
MMRDTNAKKLRGRSAIQAAHSGITYEDESRLDAVISSLYGVDIDEAAEIHLNYHVDRIVAALARRSEERGIRKSVFADRLERLELSAAAYEVAKGKLIEAGAIDALFRALVATENRGKDHGHVSFYT